jgi:hypothetical protein
MAEQVDNNESLGNCVASVEMYQATSLAVTTSFNRYVVEKK